MRADVKSELQMLRELVWWLLSKREVMYCYFCKGPLLIDRPISMTFGHRRHPKIDVDITLHHVDENRDNNESTNLVPCHSHCHKSYHAQKRALVRKEVQSLGS